MANDSLTLDQVIAQAKSAEITKQQDEILQSNASAADLSEVNDKRVPDHRGGRPKFKKGNEGDKFKRTAKKSCYKCGSQPSHTPSRCPARDVTCSACKKRGHYAKFCKSCKRVQSVEGGSGEDDVSVMAIGETVSMVENNLN